MTLEDVGCVRNATSDTLCSATLPSWMNSNVEVQFGRAQTIVSMAKSCVGEIGQLPKAARRRSNCSGWATPKPTKPRST